MNWPTMTTVGAQISACETFRYRLWRIWSDARKLVFIGLNPSTADAELNDATVRWLVRWAYTNGYGGLEICNLYAFRACDPVALKLAHFPIGVHNDAAIRAVTLLGDRDIVCGWGGHAKLDRLDRAKVVTTNLEADYLTLYRWGVNKDGSPKHPLYLPASVKLEEWSGIA